MAQQGASDVSDELKSNDEHFNNKKVEQCTCQDIHNILLFSEQGLFIDIRPENEYNQSHIKQFVNIPLNSDEENVIETLQKELSKLTRKRMEIDIYCYGNKDIMDKKIDINWYKYINQILCKYNDKGYKFKTFYILNINYQSFANKYKKLINFNSDAIEQYPSIIIENKLILGDKNDAINKEIMIEYGITHILNISMINNKFENDKDLNIKYLKFELSDSPDTSIINIVTQSIQFINNALNENNGDNNNCVLLHCYAGISRSPSVLIAYFMKTQNINYEKASLFVRNKRQIIDPNEGFVEQLKMWYNNGYKLNQQNNNNNNNNNNRTVFVVNNLPLLVDDGDDDDDDDDYDYD